MGEGEDRSPDTVTVLRDKLAARTLVLGEALWLFLESRRGDAFCSACLAAVLEAPRRIDRALMEAEGRGARRRYGPCATCGKDRLLAGLRADSSTR